MSVPVFTYPPPSPLPFSPWNLARLKDDSAAPSRTSPRKTARAAQIAAERIVRLDCHKVHTVTLLMNAKVRNHWINDPLLHVRHSFALPLRRPLANPSLYRSPTPAPTHRRA